MDSGVMHVQAAARGQTCLYGYLTVRICLLLLVPVLNCLCHCVTLVETSDLFHMLVPCELSDPRRPDFTQRWKTHL